ncbi:hypothetical protein F5148DRAFT_1196545 [Russula earlei]|uniref:Uncharacterized protein n=1 Tax=Russula earlei TaxID=71964 RepID=A0ACC0U9N8_9AGAM|nr:hypothetical protein F5148DRAFT_1196545 [Russula earlei]
MSSAPVPATDDAVIHGLNYPPDFLSSLPVLLPRPAPHTPIRALSASQFASIHRIATTSHAPDHVLFPFLHGLEGDNEQQNAFFSVTSDAPVIPPRFRGLIWVACEEDDTPSSDDESDVIASDDSDDEAGSDVGDMGHSFELDMDMDIDADLDLDHNHGQEAPGSPPSTSPSPAPIDPTCDAPDSDGAPHMHPVKCRAPRIYTNTALARDRSASSSTSSSSSSFQSLSMPSPSTPATSLDLDSPPPSCIPLGPPSPEPKPRVAPLIAFGFKPRDLLQINSDGNAEFVHLKVPDGISLRNFEIQLPIYATLSDIVVHSRRGATRAAFALAEKFKQAVEARAASRIPYHVFVLDATPAEFRTKLSHLLVGPHTINLAQREKDEMRELTRASEIITIHSPDQHDKLADNQPWTPGLGQVFLGNVNDVPFLPGDPSGRNIDLLDSSGNSPADGMGYDVCIECRLRAPRPTLGLLLSAQEHLMELERRWQVSGGKGPRPPPNAAAIVYLPFPLLPVAEEMTLFLEFLETLLKPNKQRGFGRPAKILVWSSDGYTESSVLALSLIMSVRGMTLPEAYLELQVTKKRSFFVYESDVRLLKTVEGRLARDRYAKVPSPRRFLSGPARTNSVVNSSAMSASYDETVNSPIVSMRRPRASTSPLLPSLVDDHQVWFDDPRFDGSFPSRVLPFLYLGNLNHAANVYMLHALGITHVVSVGECALIPPDSSTGTASTPSAAKTPSFQRRGSLYIEEREGRIKVLDIKGVCDDGIDTLEPQLAPICEWIDRAREQGGKVLVHCRVGVSRSATVTIAYVMKYLGISLVEAYLIVRSRRLSVLIQPNMRLLYNLCGWEVKLAHDRAAGDTERLRTELARCVNWPYLAREVHLLNEKYLHI